MPALCSGMRFAPLVIAAAMTAACNAASNGNGTTAGAPASNEAVPAPLTPVPENPVDSADPADSPPSTSPAPPPAGGEDCRGVTGSGFAAWVNAMPGPDRKPTLIVKGTITTPTGGYKVAMRLGAVMESLPVQVIAEVTATPPSDGATQAVTSHAVRGDRPMSDPVGAVIVRCGSRQLARISPVEDVS